MMPEEIKHESLHTTRQLMLQDEEYAKETIEAIRLEAIENIAKYQSQTKKWRDTQVVRKNIKDEDLVLRRKPNAQHIGKLQSKWEGPYRAMAAGHPGSLTTSAKVSQQHTLGILTTSTDSTSGQCTKGQHPQIISRGPSFPFLLFSSHFRLKIYKRACTLFLIGELQAEVRFLTEAGSM
jgi:hypothetical protein